MQVGVGYAARDLCDGQTLASPGRWPPAVRRYPRSDNWKAVVVLVKRFSECFGTAKLLMELALGRVKECSFPNEAVRELKDEVVDVLSSRRFQLKRESGDRDELPIDFRFFDLLFRASEDPDTQLGNFAQGVGRTVHEDAETSRVVSPQEEVTTGFSKGPDELATSGRETVGVPMEAEICIAGRFRR